MTAFVDYAWWQVTPAQLKAMGFSGAMRYGTQRNTKSITSAEAANLRAAGFDIGLVFESTANRAGQGSQAGHDDAVAANAFADALGYPKSCALWYAVDFDASPAQVQPYFDGIASAGGRPHAPYGSASVVDGVRYPGVGWQTAAWSSGRVSKRAGLLQNGFHDTYDSNRVLVDDFGQWRAGAHPAPQTEETENMTYFHWSGQLHAVFVNAAGQLCHFWADPGQGWRSEVRSSGNVPGATVAVDTAFAGQLHLLTPRPDSSMQHDWDDGKNWASEVIAAPAKG